ncbi:MAG: MFS transporter [Alphaproteobacteria bacterium]|nr:MFS transporter [Alphaproteobacteria bacterium]
MSAVYAPAEVIDSPLALRRLLATLIIIALGSGVMYVISVVLPAVQAEFGVSRGDASLPYTMLMVGFGVGGMVMGKIADRHGVLPPLVLGGAATCLGYILAAQAQSLWTFSLIHGLVLGLMGSAVTFAPLMADTAQWWNRRRGIAVAVCASGNYLAGAFWPTVVQWGVANWGWRDTYMALGMICGGGMLLLSTLFRMRPPRPVTAAAASSQAPTAWVSETPLGLPRWRAMALLSVAGVACCVAMSMPQVHIVAYCTDLGFGPARGAEMLSLMLACGIVSRLVSGHISDRIGGLRTLLLGSFLQGTALLLFLPFEGMAALYLASALFGLFQGGIVPSYAIIVREYFPVARAGVQTGTVIMATLLGMALGGWMSGAIFDLTGSYRAAFLNGIAWNALNLSIAIYFYRRARAMGQLR